LLFFYSWSLERIHIFFDSLCKFLAHNKASVSAHLIADPDFELFFSTDWMDALRFLFKIFICIIIIFITHPTIFCETHKYTVNKKVLETIDRYDAEAKAHKISLRKKIIYCAVGTMILGGSIACVYFYENNPNDKLAQQLFSQEINKHNNISDAIKNVSNAYPNAKLRSISKFFTDKITPTPDGKVIPPPPPPPPMNPSTNIQDTNKSKKSVIKKNNTGDKPNNNRTQEESNLINQRTQLRKAADRPSARANVNVEQPSFLDVIRTQTTKLNDASKRQLAEKPPSLQKADSLIQQISSSNLFEQVARANQDEEDDGSEDWEEDEGS
jgi:hypothetical protein